MPDHPSTPKSKAKEAFTEKINAIYASPQSIGPRPASAPPTAARNGSQGVMTVEDLRRRFSQGSLAVSAGSAVAPSSSSTMKVLTYEDLKKRFGATTPPSSTTSPRPIGTTSTPSTPTASETINILSASKIKVGNFYTVRLIFPSVLKEPSPTKPANNIPDSVQKFTTETMLEIGKDMIPTAHSAKARIGLVVDKDDDTVTIFVGSSSTQIAIDDGTSHRWLPYQFSSPRLPTQPDVEIQVDPPRFFRNPATQPEKLAPYLCFTHGIRLKVASTAHPSPTCAIRSAAFRYIGSSRKQSEESVTCLNLDEILEAHFAYWKKVRFSVDGAKFVKETGHTDDSDRTGNSQGFGEGSGDGFGGKGSEPKDDNRTGGEASPKKPARMVETEECKEHQYNKKIHLAKTMADVLFSPPAPYCPLTNKSPESVEYRRLFATKLGIELEDDQKPATEEERTSWITNMSNQMYADMEAWDAEEEDRSNDFDAFFPSDGGEEVGGQGGVVARILGPVISEDIDRIARDQFRSAKVDDPHPAVFGLLNSETLTEIDFF